MAKTFKEFLDDKHPDKKQEVEELLTEYEENILEDDIYSYLKFLQSKGMSEVQIKKVVDDYFKQ